MHWDDFSLLRKGFWDKRTYEQRVARRIAHLIMSAQIKVPPISKIWPLPDDDKLLKQASEFVNEKNLEMLNKHKAGGFEYVLENGKIIERKINLN